MCFYLPSHCISSILSVWGWQVFISSYAQNTLQRLANLRPEGERDGPKLPDCS